MKQKQGIQTSKTLQEYITTLRQLEKDEINNQEYGSILILAMVEEVGEIARAYLAEHGRKPTNITAQKDETYIHELGDLLVSILKLAIYKNVNLDHRIEYTLKKIRRRKINPKL
ncbi:MAG: MazG nucleotide pyrophosphohydrolase domain-containing protein [Patescibacteria group bacterium]